MSEEELAKWLEEHALGQRNLAAAIPPSAQDRPLAEAERYESGAALIRSLSARLKAMEEALFMAAAHCQGGHSEAGAACAELLSVPFPVRLYDLAHEAMKRGHDPAKLWPWHPEFRRPSHSANRENVI